MEHDVASDLTTLGRVETLAPEGRAGSEVALRGGLQRPRTGA